MLIHLAGLIYIYSSNGKNMRSIQFCFSILFLLSSFQGSAQRYFPAFGDDLWTRKNPSELKVNGALIDSAITYAQSMEVTNDRNLEIYHYQSFGREPFGDGVGPHKTRGDQTGIILYKGYIVEFYMHFPYLDKSLLAGDVSIEDCR